MLNSAVVITTVVLLLVVDQGAGQFWGRPQQEDEGVFSFWGRGQKEDQGAAAPYWGQSQKQQTRKQNSFQGKNRYYSQDYYYDDYEEYYDDEFSPSDKLSDGLNPEQRQRSDMDRYMAEDRGGYGYRASPGITPLIFLAPLAGVAALYAMAYVNTNPALLSLVTISGRRKRSVSLNNLDLIGANLEKDEEGAEYLKEVGIVSKFLANTPGIDLEDQRDSLMSSILQCSSIGSSQCLDSLVCEYSKLQSSYNEVEKDTITMVLYHLLASSYIEEDLKSRIRIAAGLGRKNHCKVFSCQINLKPPKA